MATLHDARRRGQPRVVYVKGAAEVILERSDKALGCDGETIPLDCDLVHRQQEAMAAQGLRVLAFARKDAAGRTRRR